MNTKNFIYSFAFIIVFTFTIISPVIGEDTNNNSINNEILTIEENNQGINSEESQTDILQNQNSSKPEENDNTPTIVIPNENQETNSEGDNSQEVFEDLFPDLKVGNEYYVGVKYLKDRGLVGGYPNGSFKPNQPINRAEAMKILVGAIPYQSLSTAEKPLYNQNQEDDNNKNLTLNNCPLSDLNINEWYFPYICKAYQKNIIEGYPDGTFKPDQTINKVESLKVTLLQAGLSLDTDYTDNFDDISPSDWFWDYAKIADQKTFIVSDRQGNLNPGQLMTRGEFSMLIYRTIKATQNNSEFGRATYYGGRFDGGKTSSGEAYDPSIPTAAHKTLPFGTIVKVTNLSNGKSVKVRINDRGPYVNGTIIDLSKTAFAELSPLSTGIFHSEVEIVN